MASRKRIDWSEDKLNFIKEEYTAQRMNTYQLAEYFGCSNDTIGRKLKAMGIQPRKFHEDLTGRKFDKLLVLGLSEKSARRLFWDCECECGKRLTVSGTHLRQGNQSSCGCLASKGEVEIAKLLQDNGFQFITQYRFDDFVSEYNNVPYRFDFAIFINNQLSYIIEFDGEQHFYYQESGSSWNTKESHKHTVELDIKKNNYCKEHKIPLIRIPYTMRGKITINDLVVETTKYLVKE